MLTQELIDFIREQMRNGKKTDNLKQTLLLHGWKEEDIDAGLEMAETPEVKVTISSAPTPKLSGIWQLFVSAWNIYKKNFWRFWLATFIYALIFGIMILGVRILLKSGPVIEMQQHFSILGVSSVIFLMLLIGLVASLISVPYRISMLLIAGNNEHKESFVEIIKRAFKRLFSFWWLNVLNALIGLACSLVGLIFLFFFVPRLAELASLEELLVVNAVILIVPVLIVTVYLSIASFIFIFEKESAFNALIKSKEYIKKDWWRIFGRLFLIGFLLVLINWIISHAFGLFAGREIVNIITQLINALVLAPILICYNYSIYKDLKEIKEVSAPSGKTKIFFIALAIIGLLEFITIIIFIKYILTLLLFLALGLSNIPM